MKTKREVDIKGVLLGQHHSVKIQSMTNTKTTDIESTIKQVVELKDNGCDLVRISVPDNNSILALKEIVSFFGSFPIVADIHFNENMALGAINAGAAKIRINPSNMPRKAMSKIIGLAKEKGVAIRIGVNKGSIHKKVTEKDLIELMQKNIKILEDENFYNIVLSIKTSSVRETISVNRMLSKVTEYPIHVGLTEAGVGRFAEVKSTVAIGALLADNIGDTIRVSLTGDPIREVKLAKEILRATEKDNNFVEIISCPTCARTEGNIEKISKEIQRYTCHINKPLKIAIMGCIVNGIGEAGDADFGVCVGREKSILFIDKKPVKNIKNTEITKEIKKLINIFTN